MKTEAARKAHAAGFASFVVRTDSVTRVFYDGDAVLAGDGEDRVHVAALAVKMHGQHRARVRSYVSFKLFRVEVVSHGIDIDEIYVRSQRHRRGGRRDPRERCGEDEITASDVERHERQKERGGGVADGAGWREP